MMFELAKGKLADARENIRAMRAANEGQSYSAAFNAAINSLRSVWEAIKTDGNRLRTSEWENWREKKWDEQSNDELLLFIHECRKDDFHGLARHIKTGGKTSFPDLERNPSPSGASEILIVGSGTYWVVDKGLPSEHMLPFGESPHQMEAWVDNPPQQHLGKAISDNSPIAICESALAYYEALIFEARQVFTK